MATRLTDYDLARILRQPDYRLIDESVYNLPVKQVRPPQLSERELQAAVIAECDRRGGEYALVYAIPNGQYRRGQRAEPGMRAGMPDLAVPVARGGYHALYLELKVGKNRPSLAQIDCMARLRAQGNRCVVVWDDAEKVVGMIEDYLQA